ncbi:MAG: HDOD domain-containing protein [Gammaproteobacteria bacterium]|nr:HDOD domain-containing protein [Gammaproteobacteria bacterium]
MIEPFTQGNRSAVPGLFDLPSISPLSSRLLAVIGNDDVSIKELANLIQQDATLTARIISLANSAYFGQTTPITSVEAAIFKSLGLRLTKNLALSIALAAPFDAGTVCPSFDKHYFWLKAVLTANLAYSLRDLFDAEHRPQADMAYLAGLLHDFGLLPLVCYLPKELNEILNPITLGLSVHQQLQQVLDTDHHEVGAMLAAKWKIPAPVVNAIMHHVEMDYEGEDQELVALIYLCSCWATQYLETGEWNVIPECAETVVQRFSLNRNELIKNFRKQHHSFSALESVADAIVGD